MSCRDLFRGTSRVLLPLGLLARLPYAIVPLALLLLLLLLLLRQVAL